MRLPSHVITKLYLAGTMGTVGAIALLHPLRHETACTPVTGELAPTAVEIETAPLAEAFRTPDVPAHVVVKKPPPIPVQIKVRPKTPPRTFASSCGHLVPMDPNNPVAVVKCGKG
jgi:hypothetical protein